MDLRSISSIMPWMWPPEIPWKSMAGGRKGHASSSARHPTISIYTRPGLSAHPREGAEGTAKAARCGSAETLGDTGQEGDREEERGRQGGRWSGWKRRRKRRGINRPSGSLKETCRKQTNTGGAEGRRRRRILTAPRDRVTNEKQLQREVGQGGTKSVRKENSFEHKERKRSAIFGGPWLLASSQRL